MGRGWDIWMSRATWGCGDTAEVPATGSPRDGRVPAPGHGSVGRAAAGQGSRGPNPAPAEDRHLRRQVRHPSPPGRHPRASHPTSAPPSHGNPPVHLLHHCGCKREQESSPLVKKHQLKLPSAGRGTRDPVILPAPGVGGAGTCRGSSFTAEGSNAAATPSRVISTYPKGPSPPTVPITGYPPAAPCARVPPQPDPPLAPAPSAAG